MRYQGLDGLRGIAALAIAVFHFHGNWGGYLAVDLFLMLSGFVLAHRHATKQESPAEFIVARIARLYPLHIVTLCLFALVAAFIEYEEPLYVGNVTSVVLQQLTLTHNVGLNPTGLNFNYPSWSVSVEFWINVLFIIVLMFLRNVYWLLVPVALGLFCIFIQVGHLDVHYQNAYGVLNYGLLRGLVSFFVGVVLYSEHIKRQSPASSILDLTAILAMIAVVVVVLVRPYANSTSDFLVLPLFVLLISSVACDKGAVANFIAQLSPLGEISYSIYLNQIPVLLLVRWFGSCLGINDYLMFIAYIVFLLIFSRLTFWWIEVPMKSLATRVLLSRLPTSLRGHP